MSSLLKLDPTGNYWETTQNCPVQKRKTKIITKKEFFFSINKNKRRARKGEKEVKKDKLAGLKRGKGKRIKNVPSWSDRILLRLFQNPSLGENWCVINDERDKGLNEMVWAAREGGNVELPSEEILQQRIDCTEFNTLSLTTGRKEEEEKKAHWLSSPSLTLLALRKTNKKKQKKIKRQTTTLFP